MSLVKQSEQEESFWKCEHQQQNSTTFLQYYNCSGLELIILSAFVKLWVSLAIFYQQNVTIGLAYFKGLISR